MGSDSNHTNHQYATDFVVRCAINFYCSILLLMIAVLSQYADISEIIDCCLSIYHSVC